MNIAADNPIRNPEDDVLGRAGLAGSFVEDVLSIDASEGLVVGVLGPWGSGKTSFLNLARTHFASSGATLLDFNPWMFSGAEQLVESFFVELAAQLKLRPGLADIGKSLEEYGEGFSGLGWLPLVGPWIERGRGATKILAKLLQRRKEGVGGRRAKLEGALRELKAPIVVVLDDIDRLTTQEIRDVFKLVRLTASFPNIIYVVAFDRIRVESALEEQGIPGRDYLEKILQVGVDLPRISDRVLTEQVTAAINRAVDGLPAAERFDPSLWPDVFIEIVRPLLKNMRDIRRYAAAIRGTARSVGGQIELVDLLALEAVRTFRPDLFHQIPLSTDGLTQLRGGFGSYSDPPHLKTQIEQLIKHDDSNRPIATALIKRLFPAGDRHIGGSGYDISYGNVWLRNRRVASEDILRLYLERVSGEGLEAFADAEIAWGKMTDQEAFDSFLRSLESERCRDTISALEAYETEFTEDHIEPAIVTLINLVPELPDQRSGMFNLTSGLYIGRLNYRLLRVVDDPDKVEALVRHMLPQLRYLSGKIDLIHTVGHREGRGHKFVSESTSGQLEREWRDEVRAASTTDLISEPNLLGILSLCKEASDEATLGPIDASPQMTLALLNSARGEIRIQSLDSRSETRTPTLAWDQLVKIYGAEDILSARINAAREAANVHDPHDVLALAAKYSAGWRPDHEDFMRRD